jgi:hypothetical protein
MVVSPSGQEGVSLILSYPSSPAQRVRGDNTAFPLVPVMDN